MDLLKWDGMSKGFDGDAEFVKGTLTLAQSCSNIASRFALFPLRLIAGFGFLAHGWAKFHRGPEKFAVLLHQVGVPFPSIMAWIGTVTELLGGAALIAGIVVALACIPLIGTMLVAMVTIHVHFGFSAVNTIAVTAAGPQFGPPGYEINLIYIAALIALACSKPTPFSIDAFLKRQRSRDRDTIRRP
jgi:putative oxidoreductase